MYLCINRVFRVERTKIFSFDLELSNKMIKHIFKTVSFMFIHNRQVQYTKLKRQFHVYLFAVVCIGPTLRYRN